MIIIIIIKAQGQINENGLTSNLRVELSKVREREKEREREKQRESSIKNWLKVKTMIKLNHLYAIQTETEAMAIHFFQLNINKYKSNIKTKKWIRLLNHAVLSERLSLLFIKGKLVIQSGY